MDDGSGDGVRTIGTGRGRGREECLGPARLARRRGNDEKKGVLGGLPVGAERRKGKMGVSSAARGKGRQGEEEFRVAGNSAGAVVDGMAHEEGN
jgi:hypothetical protein